MQPSKKQYDLFISYSRKDDETFVRRLYKDLQKRGYNPWYDRVSLKGGFSFLQSIRDALAENPIRLILVLGPHAALSEYVKNEWQFALGNCQFIVPILRLGISIDNYCQPIELDKDYELIPEPLQKRKLHCIDFRSKRNYQDAF